jgi:carboxylesterase type B
MTGGSFATGDCNKVATNTWAKHLASRGFVAIVIDYRLEHPGPPDSSLNLGEDSTAAQGEGLGGANIINVTALAGFNQAAAYDAKATVRWLNKHAQEYRVSTDHIVAFGSSAGGMTVAWLTGVRADGEGDSDNAGFPSNITAGISLSGTLSTAQRVRPNRARAVSVFGLSRNGRPDGADH